MTRYLAVTTCNAQMWERHGLKMADTFRQHWPPNVPFWLYAEKFWPDFSTMPTGKICALDIAAPWLPMFKTLYSDPKYRGVVNGKYDYHWDAVKFAHKVAAIGAAAEGDDCDVLIWIDADVITHAQVTTEWLDRLLPLPATIAMIERAVKYPECGFMMFRLPAAQEGHQADREHVPHGRDLRPRGDARQLRDRARGQEGGRQGRCGGCAAGAAGPAEAAPIPQL